MSLSIGGRGPVSFIHGVFPVSMESSTALHSPLPLITFMFILDRTRGLFPAEFPPASPGIHTQKHKTKLSTLAIVAVWPPHPFGRALGYKESRDQFMPVRPWSFHRGLFCPAPVCWTDEQSRTVNPSNPRTMRVFRSRPASSSSASSCDPREPGPCGDPSWRPSRPPSPCDASRWPRGG